MLTQRIPCPMKTLLLFVKAVQPATMQVDGWDRQMALMERGFKGQCSIVTRRQRRGKRRLQPRR